MTSFPYLSPSGLADSRLTNELGWVLGISILARASRSSIVHVPKAKHASPARLVPTRETVCNTLGPRDTFIDPGPKKLRGDKKVEPNRSGLARCDTTTASRQADRSERQLVWRPKIESRGSGVEASELGA